MFDIGVYSLVMFFRMSKELREKMVKQAKVHAEKAKVGVRKARQKAISDVRKQSASEDTTRKLEKHVSCILCAQLHTRLISMEHMPLCASTYTMG